jgi:mRNA export factor
MVTAAGADKKIHVLQAATGQTTSFAAHDAPIRDVRFVDIPSAGAPIIASGSWDKTVRYWDIRNSSQPVATVQLPERVYAMDTSGPLLVISTADGQCSVVNLHTNPAALLRTDKNKLKHQTRSLSVSPSGKYWATGSIEGRASVQAVDLAESAQVFPRQEPNLRLQY